MKEKIYPTIPSAPSDYRIQYIREIKNYIESNRDLRKCLSKKYSKALTGIHFSNYTLNIISTATGISSVALLTTIIALPASIALSSVSISTGCLGLLLNKINRKLKIKEEKHRNIYNLCQSKLNTIESILSKAIVDNHISDEEYQLILAEEKHFRIVKEEMRKTNNKKFNTELSDKEKNDLKESMKKLFEKI